MGATAPRAAGIAAVLAASAVIASVVARLVVTGTASGPARAYGYTDIHRMYVELPFTTLHWPYLRFPFDYHPLLGWTAGALSLASDHPVTLVLLWAVILAAAAALVALVLSRLAPARRIVAYWALSPQLLLFAGHNFDVIPVLGLAGACLATRAGRQGLAGAAIGLGTAAKLFPIAALPPLALSLARRSPGAAIAAILAAAAVLLAIDGPAVLAPYSLLGTGHNPYRYAGNLDTVWTPVRLVLGLGLDAGATELVVRVASGVGMAASYAWWVLRPALRGAAPVPLFWRSVVVILLWTQLYSPQYSIWVLPAFVLLVPCPGIFALLAAGDVLTWATIFPLSVGAGSEPVVAALFAGVLLRHAALALLLRRLVLLPERA